MKHPFAWRDLPAGYQANKERDKEPGTSFPRRDPTFLVLVTVSFVLIGIMTVLLVGDIHELRSGTPPETPRLLPAFATASLPRRDPQPTQIAAPALSPVPVSKPEIDRTAPLPEPGQTMFESHREDFSAAESQFDRPRETTVRRKVWFKRSSIGSAKKERAIDANVAFVARKTKPAEDEIGRQLVVLKRYLERRNGEARDLRRAASRTLRNGRLRDRQSLSAAPG